MSKMQGEEQELKFDPFFQESDIQTNKTVKKRFSPNQAALVVHDLIVVNLAFAFGLWITGLKYFAGASSTKFMSILVFFFRSLPFSRHTFFTEQLRL